MEECGQTYVYFLVQKMTVPTARCIAVVEYMGRKHMDTLAVHFSNCSEYYMWGRGWGWEKSGVKRVIRSSRATALWILENVSR